MEKAYFKDLETTDGFINLLNKIYDPKSLSIENGKVVVSRRTNKELLITPLKLKHEINIKKTETRSRVRKIFML